MDNNNHEYLSSHNTTLSTTQYHTPSLVEPFWDQCEGSPTRKEENPPNHFLSRNDSPSSRGQEAKDCTLCVKSGRGFSRLDLVYDPISFSSGYKSPLSSSSTPVISPPPPLPPPSPSPPLRRPGGLEYRSPRLSYFSIGLRFRRCRQRWTLVHSRGYG